MVDIPNDNNMPPTDDDDKYSESSEGRSDDKDIDDNPSNVTIPAELISHLGLYWDHPEDKRRSDVVYWVARLDYYFNGDKKALELSISDRYVLSVLLDIHIKDELYVDAITTSHTSKTIPQFGFNCDIKEFGQEGWEVIKLELKDNLIGMEGVSFVKPSDLEDDLVKIKVRGFADG